MIKQLYRKFIDLFSSRASKRAKMYSIITGTAPKKDQDEFWMGVMKKASAEQRKVVEAADKLLQSKPS